jgi:hypothetical protein
MSDEAGSGASKDSSESTRVEKVLPAPELTKLAPAGELEIALGAGWAGTATTLLTARGQIGPQIQASEPAASVSGAGAAPCSPAATQTPPPVATPNSST